MKSKIVVVIIVLVIILPVCYVGIREFMHRKALQAIPKASQPSAVRNIHSTRHALNS